MSRKGQTQTWREHNKHFSNMALYETRIHRMIARNKRELTDLHTIHKAVEAAAHQEAELLLEEKLAEQDPINTTEPIEIDGLVFFRRKASGRNGSQTSPGRSPLVQIPQLGPLCTAPLVHLNFPKAG